MGDQFESVLQLIAQTYILRNHVTHLSHKHQSHVYLLLLCGVFQEVGLIIVSTHVLVLGNVSLS
jgi:hypothetical protein